MIEQKEKDQAKIIRMPLSLAEEAVKQAKTEHRSFNGFVNYAVKKYLESQRVG